MDVTTESRHQLVSRLQERIDKVLSPHKTYFPLVLLDFPDHPNVGDSAIWLGELEYFKRYWFKRPSIVSRTDNVDWTTLEDLPPTVPIFLHGGGNFGDIWPEQQAVRDEILRRFTNRPVIQLPQTVFFQNPAAFSRTAKAIERHGNFSLFVRDERSLAAAAPFQCRLVLCPDMAFALGPLESMGTTSRDTLWLMRTDKELGLNRRRNQPHPLQSEDWMKDDFAFYKRALIKTRCEHPFGRRNLRDVRLFERLASERMKRGLRLLSSAREIVTDRLHGHILSLLLDKPHTVIDTGYGKLESFIECWTANYDRLSLHKSLISGE